MYRIVGIAFIAACVSNFSAEAQRGSGGAPEYIVPQPAAGVVIDGKLDDPFWSNVPMRQFQQAEDGVPVQLAGTFGAALQGNWLCFAANFPEPGGKVLARAIGRNPVWQKDAYGSPPVEDRLEYRLFYRANGGAERQLTVTLNPWAAYTLDRDGKIMADAEIEAAALVNTSGWTIEAALPLSLLGMDQRSSSPQMRLQAVHIRSRRPRAPEFLWYWPGTQSQATLRLPSGAGSATDGRAPDFRPPALGNIDPPIEVGHVSHTPPIAANWDDAAWRDVPAFSLPRNEPSPRAPRYPTQVKWVHDGRTLSLLFRVEEPEPLVARVGGRDSGFASDDHLTIYLATSGSAFIEILVNTVGGIRDSLARGPHMASLDSRWNTNIKAQTTIRYGHWIARIDVPLEECAQALGESKNSGAWRILLSRYRAARPGEAAEISALPAIGTETFYGPVRYGHMLLSDRQPSSVAQPIQASERKSQGQLVPELAALDSRVWPPLYRRYHNVRNMVAAQQRKRVEQTVLAERKAWEAVSTLQDWERFRDVRLGALREAVGQFPPHRVALDVHVTARHSGDGYRLENLVYQSRPGFYVPANLYLPANPSSSVPSIIVLHSFHYPKTQGELHDMGQLWARTGCAVLIPERLGFGERVETTPWNRQAYASRVLFRQQLNLIGESHMAWMAWDAIRAVDLLYERSDVDRKRVIVIGAVAGGAEPAAVAAALDSRISALVPYNYDHGRVRLDADFPGELTKHFDMSLITASLAPRRYVHAFEFGWEGAAEPDFPELWTSSWLRSRKVWGLYDALDNLGTATGYGLIRLSMERVSHAWSVGPQHRVDLYPLFQRWFQIPLPSTEDQAILPDSELTVNPYKEEARRQEAQRRRPHSDLLSIPPAVSAKLPRKQLHEVAYAMAVDDLAAARRRHAGLNGAQTRRQLQNEMGRKLGDIEPAPGPHAETFWVRSLAAAKIEAIGLNVEDGITLPLLLIRPEAATRAAVVVAVAKDGKDRFLSDRGSEIEKLVKAGVAVCLPDLRGTGETSPDPDWQNDGRNLAETEVALGNTLLGARLKDLRTVLAYLRSRPEVDSQRLALWGDSFAPANPRDLFLDELESEAGPQIQYHAEPLGGMLALITPLFEDGVRAVAARGGLAAYLDVLKSAFPYVPVDAIVPGILKSADIADIAAAYAPRPLLLGALVSGRNVRLSSAEVEGLLAAVKEAYAASRAPNRLVLQSEPLDVGGWLASQLK